MISLRLCLWVALLLPMLSGCAISKKFDTMIYEMRSMRRQLRALDETNQRLAEMNGQLLELEQINTKLSALEQTNEGIDGMQMELLEMKRGISRMDKNMEELLGVFTEEE